MSPNTSTSSLTQPCSSAKAVHDMRCPNYTGFKPRLGARSDAAAPSGLDPASLGRELGRTLQRGVASWYGPRFHGQRTASGEPYDMHELTAAHNSLPFGTRVLVQNPRTGKQVVVRINDRGPFVAGRVIDLSRAAAKALGMLERGHDTVVLRELVNDGVDALLVSAEDSISLR
ncbi:MAG: septal ring lytic transglycosylase RlpA family protein [Burkholderiaceae bacterium]